MTNNNIRDMYRLNIKILIVLIFSFLVLFASSTKLNQDYTNYKNLYFELDNDFIPYENQYDNFLLNLYYSTNFEYNVYMVLLFSFTVIIFDEGRNLYKKLKEVKKLNN